MVSLKDTNIEGTVKVLGGVHASSLDLNDLRLDGGTAVIKNNIVSTFVKSQKIHISVYIDKVRSLIYVGVPAGMDVSGIDLMYMRYSTVKSRGKIIEFGNRMITTVRRHWHRIKKGSNAASFNDYSLINFRIGDPAAPDFARHGYDYYYIEGQCYEQGQSEVSNVVWINDMWEYGNLPHNPVEGQESSKFLPTGYSGLEPGGGGRDWMVPIGKILSHKNAGICLVKDGEIISDVAIMRWQYKDDYAPGQSYWSY